MKRKIKKWTALLLSVLMTSAMVLSGCGNGSGNNNENSTTKTSGGNKQTDSSGQRTDSGAAAGENSTSAEGEPYEVVMTYLYYGTLSPDLQMVEDAINEISVKKINVKVSFLPLSFSEIATQPSLMISSGEKLDLMLCFQQPSFLDAVNKNMVIPLDELYAQYGTDIAENLDVAITGGYADGTLYGIPSTRCRATSNGIFFVTEYLEKYGFDPEQKVTYEVLDELFAKVKAGEGENFYPLIMSGSTTTTFEFFNAVDFLGADAACGGIIDYLHSEDNQVVNIFESEAYANHVKWMHKWYEAGYINGDAVTSTEPTQQLVKNGMGMSYLLQTYWDMEANQERGMACDMTMGNLTGDFCNTGVYQGQTWCIPITCEDPEAAFKFLNLLYGDEEVLNMIYWGLEGVHYERTDEDGIITYLDGMNANNVTYSQPLGLYGAVSKMYQMTPWTADYFRQMDEFNASITEDIQSPYLGYVFNTKNVKTDYAAVSDVLTQYRASLETGSVNPEVVLPEFLKALEAAGIDNIIEENQNSLNEWLASQK